jgi:hypothetical protein
VVKTDSSGAILWSETIGGWADERANWIEQTNDGGYIIAGTTNSFDAGWNDVYLIKIDITGGLLWTKIYGGAGDDYGKCVKQVSDSGYVILAESYEDSVHQLLLIRTDKNGILLWSEALDGRYGNSLIETYDKGYAITGEVDNAGPSPQTFMSKMNPNGSLVWSKTYGGHSGQSLLETSGGGFILLGDSADIIKTDNEGNIIQAKRYGAPGTQNLGMYMSGTKYHGYVITGLKNMITQDYDVFLFKADSLGNSGCADLPISRIASGFQQQVKEVSLTTANGGAVLSADTKVNKVNTAIQTLANPVSNFSYNSDTTLTVSFYKSSFNDLAWRWDFGDGNVDSTHSTIYHTFADAGTYNVCLTVMNNCGSDTNCKTITVTKPGAVDEKHSYDIKIYPNPGKDYIFIKLSDLHTSDPSVRIYNSWGSQVYQKDQIKDNILKIERNTLPPGAIYFIRITDKTGFTGSAKFIFE